MRTLPPQNHREFWTPERRALQALRSIRKDSLSLTERERIIADARTERPYIEIALDYLISTSRVSQIARAAGIRRNAPHARAT